MELKPGYKQTEIGVIPDDWEPAKFGSLCHRRRESGVPTAESFLIELEHIESGSGRLVGEAPVQTMSSKRVFQKGDVLFGRLRSYLRKYLLAERDGFCSTEIWALVPENERVESGFLFQVVRLDGFITATGISYGTHMPRSDWSTIKEWPLSLPPVKEQKAIAVALSDVDALIDSLEALLTKKRNIKTGVMQELLTGRTRLPGFTGDWQDVRLGDIGTMRGGTGFPVRYQGGDSGIPFYKVSDMNNPGNEVVMQMANNYVFANSVKSMGAVLHEPGSIVFAKVGAAVFLERKRILSCRSCIDNNMMSFTLDSSICDVKFVHHALQRVRFGDLVSTTALPSINGSVVAEVRIPLPLIKEQKAIAAVLSDIDDEIEALEKRLAKTRDLKQGMAQELLTGRTRLI